VEGENPLFDNLRDNIFTTAGLGDATSARPDPPAATTRNALKVDLSSSGEIDLVSVAKHFFSLSPVKRQKKLELSLPSLNSLF